MNEDPLVPVARKKEIKFEKNWQELPRITKNFIQ